MMIYFEIVLTLVISYCYCFKPFHPVKERMELAGIVPDVIDNAPTLVVEVAYDDGRECYLGCEIKPIKVKDPPKRVTWKRKPYSYYTLCLVDPDVPNRKKPKNKQWLHWLIVNMPGTHFPVDNGTMPGETLAEYIGSFPRKNSGLHRYVFLVYMQPIKIISFDKEPRLTNKSAGGRANFSVRNFTKKYNLGDPVAGNFYVAQWDESVPDFSQNNGC